MSQPEILHNQNYGRARRAIGSHQSARMENDEWLTPPGIIDALGPFDLDPCAPIARPWPTAREHYTREDSGLQRPWHGRVWLNPPYSREAVKWLARLAEHGRGECPHLRPHRDRMVFLDHLGARDGLAIPAGASPLPLR